MRSADGARIDYHSLGSGPGLIVVGGVLASALDYLPLASTLSSAFEVHLIERRGRPGSDAQRPDHSIDTECEDLFAVTRATGSAAVFGHSFGGLVALEAARRRTAFEEVHVYEPGVALGDSLSHAWLDEYQTLLDRGDRRGAFAVMVQGAGFAPRVLQLMPREVVRLALRAGIRGQRWARLDRLMDANLTEHRIQRDLATPTAERFSTIDARTSLLGGSSSPAFISTQLLGELRSTIPHSSMTILPNLGHLAPIENPRSICDAVLAGRRGEPSRGPIEQ